MTINLQHCRLGLLLVMLTGCNGAGTEELKIEESSLAGTWRGGFTGETAFMSAVLTLTAQDTVIGGSGFISGSGIECEVSIDGRLRGERILFDMVCGAYPPIFFRGSRVSATRMTGTVAGSGIPPNDMRLDKQ
jgi:hypothetical protein